MSVLTVLIIIAVAVCTALSFFAHIVMARALRNSKQGSVHAWRMAVTDGFLILAFGIAFCIAMIRGVAPNGDYIIVDNFDIILLWAVPFIVLAGGSTIFLYEQIKIARILND